MAPKFLNSSDLHLAHDPTCGDAPRIRGLVQPAADLAPDASASYVRVVVVNDDVTPERGFEAACLPFHVPGDEARGEAFFVALATAFISFPLSIEALVYGWWAQPQDEYEAVLVERTPEEYTELEALFGSQG